VRLGLGLGLGIWFSDLGIQKFVAEIPIVCIVFNHSRRISCSFRCPKPSTTPNFVALRSIWIKNATTGRL
jgi:hypothetical protein